MHVIDCIHPTHRERIARLYRGTAEGLSPGTRDETLYVRKDGGAVWGSRVGTPVRTPDGELLGLAVTLVDITDRKRREEETRDANAELERLVGKRTADLTAVNQRLQDELGLRQETEASLRATEDDRRRLVEQLLTAQERERTEIARELHDQAGQALSSLLVGLKSLRKMDDDESDRHIDTLRATTGRVLDEVRTLSFALRPPSLDEFGLVAALERDMEVMQKQGDVRLDFVADETVPSELPDDVEIAVYRVVHAALTNARQHARAENVSVLLRVRGALLHVIVDDDGVGFDVESVLDGPVEGRFGLLAMQERLRPVAGSVEFESAPGAGSTVFIRVPTGPDTPSGDSAR
ncbi:PAS domain S-box protein [Candidatus Poribacteria bacterium]|nr:PAS domain S-box protein [Candidatus Poribacteria bacterium]